MSDVTGIVRILTTSIKGSAEILAGNINSTILDFFFDSAGEDDLTVPLTSNQAGIYTSNILTNIATVVYKVNTVVKTLPITLVDTDDFEVIITRTNPVNDSRVVLNGTS